MDLPIKEGLPLLTITEAAAFLTVSKATIRRWTDDGRLACLRIGARNERRFHQADLAALMTKSDSKFQPEISTVESQKSLARSVPGSISGHHCIVSNTAEEEWGNLAPAILKALEEGTPVLMVEVSDRKRRLADLLRGKGLSVRKLSASHMLHCVSVEDSYFLSGEFCWDRAVAFIESAILTAKARGFEKILIIGADSGRADSIGPGYADELKKYELGLDNMLTRYPGASVLCPYTASEISAELMIQGFLTHPKMSIHATPVQGLLGMVAI